MANRFFAAIKARFFNSPANTAVDIGVNGDANPRISIDAGGRLSWGDGNSPVDTNLYRSASNYLKTNSAFAANKFNIDNIAEIITSNVSLVTASASQAIDISSCRSVKYLIHAESATDFEVTEILAIKNTTNLNYIEYGKISTNNNDLATYDVVLDSGNAILKVTPSTTNMSFRVFKIMIA